MEDLVWKGFEAFSRASASLPLWKEWTPRCNTELLLQLNEEAEYSPERKDWFKNQLLHGTLPSGPTLGSLGVKQKDLGDPVDPLRKRIQKDPIEGFAYLKVLFKMLKLGAIARIPEGDTEIAGVSILSMPNFTIEQKGKSRLVTNYSERIRISKMALQGPLKEWIRSPGNRAEWNTHYGKLSYNSLIRKVDSTLSYLGVKDLAAMMLALGEGAWYVDLDISGAFYQILQALEKLAYQVKIIPLRNGFARVVLMGREMGDANAPCVGNLDTGTPLLLAEVHAKKTKSKASYRYSREEVVPPSTYGLNDDPSPHDLRYMMKKQRRKKQNELGIMHHGGERFVEYRCREEIKTHIHFQDDALLGKLKIDLEKAIYLARHAYDFFEDKARKKLSTSDMIPSNHKIFCGLHIEGTTLGFAREKWEKYDRIIKQVTESEWATAAQIMTMNGVLANAASLFPLLKIALALIAHHFAVEIRTAIGAEKNFRLKLAWRKLLKKKYVVSKILKNAVSKYWNMFFGKRVHARNFVLTPGDATETDIYSTDADPRGIGIVCHYTGVNWGAILDPEKSVLINRAPWGKVSSCSFETDGVLAMTRVVPDMKRIHKHEFRRIFRSYNDNEGTEIVVDPTNPKFRGDYLAAQMLLQKSVIGRT